MKWNLVLLAVLASAATVPAQARTLDPNTPEDALEISKRVQCGEADGKPAVYHWSGRAL